MDAAESTTFRYAGRLVRPLRRRMLGVLLVALLAFSVAGLAQRGGEDGPIPERQTICWECHVSWPALPLRSLYDVVVASEDTPVGEDPTHYPIRIRNPWLHDVVYLEAAMDLSGAPSLAFTSDQSPILGDAQPGEIQPDHTQPLGPWETNLTVEVPPSATSLRLVVAPAVRTPPSAPRLEMEVFPGGNTSRASPVDPVRAPGAGQDVVFEADAEALRTLGTGNWTVVVRANPVDPGDLLVNPLGSAADYRFTLTRDVWFDVVDSRTSYRSTRETLAREENVRMDFILRRVAQAQPGETVRIVVNATVFYDHDDADNDDYGNVTKSRSVAVVMDGGTLVLRPPEDAFPTNGARQTTVSPARISEAIGYLATFLLIASIWSGGMFGRRSRRQLNQAFGSAKRRVAFHNFLSYGLTVAAIVHLVVFLVESAFYWTLGIIWGSVALLAMVGLGLTGALQVPMIRRWNYATWKWTHWGLTVVSIVFTIVHILLDGANFTDVQNAIGWTDPLDPRL